MSPESASGRTCVHGAFQCDRQWSTYSVLTLLDVGPSGGAFALGGAGWGLSVIAGIASAVIASRKGYSSYQVVMHALSAFLCIGWIGLISALLLKDLALEKRLDAVEAHRRQRQHRNLNTFAADSQPATSPRLAQGQVRCPRCGSMNAMENQNCWHCDLRLPTVVAAPPAAFSMVPAPPPAKGPLRRPKHNS